MSNRKSNARNLATKTVSASQFKTECSRLLEFVHKTGRPILITKRGKPIAKLVPVLNEPDKWFGRLKGKMKVVGDIVSPIDPSEVWESS